MFDVEPVDGEVVDSGMFDSGVVDVEAVVEKITPSESNKNEVVAENRSISRLLNYLV